MTLVATICRLTICACKETGTVVKLTDRLADVVNDANRPGADNQPVSLSNTTPNTCKPKSVAPAAPLAGVIAPLGGSPAALRAAVPSPLFTYKNCFCSPFS